MRAARGSFWTVKGLAEVCGITAAALTNIETGKRCPRDETKWRIAGALRRPVGELFPWPDEIPPFPTFVQQRAAEAASA